MTVTGTFAKRITKNDLGFAVVITSSNERINISTSWNPLTSEYRWLIYNTTTNKMLLYGTGFISEIPQEWSEWFFRLQA